MRKYVSLKILRSIYILQFLTSTYPTAVLSGQNYSNIQQIVSLQKKTVRIGNFQPRNFIPVIYSNKTSS